MSEFQIVTKQEMLVITNAEDDMNKTLPLALTSRHLNRLLIGVVIVVSYLKDEKERR